MGEALLVGRFHYPIFAALIAVAGPLHAGLPAACDGAVHRVAIRSDVEVLDPGTLLAAAPIEIGAPLREESLQRSLRALRATGLAGTVEALCAPEGGGVGVEFVLRGSIQVTSVELVGDLGLKRRDLAELVPQKVGEPLVEDRVIRGVYRLQDRLQEQGYFGSSVRIAIDLDEEAKRARVVYETDAGRRSRIGEVVLDADLGEEEMAELESRVKEKPGKLYAKAAIRTEPERLEHWLREHGYLRAIVGEAEESLDPESGSVDLRYPIEVGPRIDVVVTGAKRKALERKGLLPFLDGAGYDDALVVQSRAAIERYFQGQGYYDVAVTSVEDSADGIVRLTLEVDLGSKSEVEAVRFSGNTEVSSTELAARIETTEKRFLTPGSGRLVDETLDADLENLRSFYALSGLPDAVVGPADVTRLEKELVIEIPVIEGERRRVVELEFEGIEALERQTLSDEIFLRAGGPYHPLLLDESVNAIQAVYQEHGFSAVSVDAVLDWGSDELLVDVLFRVAEGPRTVVEGVILRGNQRTQAELVHRAMDLQPGDPVSARSLLEVQRRLYGLGIFSRVGVNTVPGTPYSSGRDVLVALDEGKRTKIRYGLGWDSEDGVRGLLGYTRNNLFGRGVSARFDLQTSQHDREARILIRQPYVGLKEVPIRYSIFDIVEEQDSYDSERRGVQVEASRKLGRSHWSLLYTFKFVDTELKPPLVELDRELASVEISSLTPGFFTDRRNDPINPTRGSTSTIQLEYAFPFLSADSHEFAKLFVQRTGHVPLDRYGTLAVSLRLAGIEPIGDENLIDPSVPEDVPSRFVPISERLFGGGPSTHRAFRLDELAIEGESAIDGAAFGGNGLVLFNLDYRFPIAGALGGTAFFDTGNVWGDWRGIDFDEMRHGAGIGLRYLSPIGPLRVGMGWKLDREPGESPREIFISFGHPF